MTPSPRHTLALLLLLIAALPLPLASQTWTPEPGGRVTDLAKVLSTEENDCLTRLLADYEEETRHQIAILTIPTLAGESIEDFSIRVANEWGLGLEDVDNGILIVLAIEERRVRISLGFGFERYITDARAGEIINIDMIPFFREFDYAGGLESGLRQLMKDGRRFVVPGE